MSDVEVRIITPPVAESAIDHDLVALTEYIHAKTSPNEPYGYGLGGPFGYGIEYDNAVFSMFPFYWGECECGFEDRSTAFWETNPHASECFSPAYDAEAARLRTARPPLSFNDEHDRLIEWAKAHGYAKAPYGMAVHCDCGAAEKGRVWHKANDHDPACGVARPNFLHKRTGLRIDWYKWIGRDMEFSRKVGAQEWRRIFDECVESVRSA